MLSTSRKPVQPFSLYVKSRFVGTRLGDARRYVRWLVGSINRRQHPELWELYLEKRQTPYVLQRLLANDSSCVDVGCHIGSFLSYLIKYAPQGRHVAFEASRTKSE